MIYRFDIYVDQLILVEHVDFDRDVDCTWTLEGLKSVRGLDPFKISVERSRENFQPLYYRLKKQGFKFESEAE